MRAIPWALRGDDLLSLVVTSNGSYYYANDNGSTYYNSGTFTDKPVSSIQYQDISHHHGRTNNAVDTPATPAPLEPSASPPLPL
eukprot:1323482-Amorphochlora_amoeboformis.AAC.1